MTEQIVVRLTPQDAKEQLAKRRALGGKLYHDTDHTNPDREQWHQINGIILENIFSTDSIGANYRRQAKSMIESGNRGLSDTVMDYLNKHLDQLIETLPSFPYRPPTEPPGKTGGTTAISMATLPTKTRAAEGEHEIYRARVVVERGGPGECIVTNSRLIIRSTQNDLEHYPWDTIRSLRLHGPTWSETIKASACWIDVTLFIGEGFSIKDQRSDPETKVLLRKFIDVMAPF